MRRYSYRLEQFIRVSISTLSLTSTSRCSMLTKLSMSSSRASMRCLVNQFSRMGGVYFVADSRTWWSSVVWLRPCFLGLARLSLTSRLCVGRRMHFAKASQTSGWRACCRQSNGCSLSSSSFQWFTLRNFWNIFGILGLLKNLRSSCSSPQDRNFLRGFSTWQPSYHVLLVWTTVESGYRFKPKQEPAG